MFKIGDIVKIKKEYIHDVWKNNNPNELDINSLEGLFKIIKKYNYHLISDNTTTVLVTDYEITNYSRQLKLKRLMDG